MVSANQKYEHVTNVHAHKPVRVAFARVNYSQLYGVYDEGMTLRKRDVLIPYHLITLAAHLRDQGFEVGVFDAEVDLLSQEQLAREIVDWGADLVGLTATTPDINLTLDVCRLLKLANPSIVTVVGGPHASAQTENVAQQAMVDYVVVGDGEFPMNLIIAKEKGVITEEIIREGCVNDRYFSLQMESLLAKPTKVILGRLNTLGSSPLPAHDLLDYSKYLFTDPLRGSVKCASIMSSRGCPFECAFCHHDRSLRYRPVDVFLEEIESLVQKQGVQYFYVYDDTFTVNKRRTLQILTGIRSMGLRDVHFQCLTRGNLVDDDIIMALLDAGFVRVSMGIESGSEQILKIIRKGVKLEDFVATCRKLSQASIETRGSMILGHPYETKETIQQSIDFCKELDLYMANFNIMTPYPGTAVYEMARQGQGIRFRNPEDATNWQAYRRWGVSLIETDGVTGEELEFYQKHAQMAFYTQDKVYAYYEHLFHRGNKSRYFYRPLNFAWRRCYNQDIPFWNELEEAGLVSPGNNLR